MRYDIIYFLLIQAESWKYRGNRARRAYLKKVQITQNNVINEISLSRPINYLLTLVIALS